MAKKAAKPVVAKATIKSEVTDVIACRKAAEILLDAGMTKSAAKLNALAERVSKRADAAAEKAKTKAMKKVAAFKKMQAEFEAAGIDVSTL